MKHFFCIVIMLTIMPVTAAIGLVVFDPKNWGGPPTIQNILMMALFGLISVPLWITYIPSLLATPSIMNDISANILFHSIPVWKFIALSLTIGAIVGILILSPSIYMSRESLKLMLNWAWAGAFSGSITFTIISLIYRKY